MELVGGVGGKIGWEWGRGKGFRYFRFIRFMGLVWRGGGGAEGDDGGFATGGFAVVFADFEKEGVGGGEVAGDGCGEVVAVVELAEGNGAAAALEQGEEAVETGVDAGAEVVVFGIGEEFGLAVGEPAHE